MTAETHPMTHTKATAVESALQQVGVQFDPTIIIKIITAILSMIGMCAATPAKAKSIAANPSRLQKLALRRTVFKLAPTLDHEAITDALLDAGTNVTTPEMTALLKESKAT